MVKITKRGDVMYEQMLHVFEDNSEISRGSDGLYTIKCKKGLWAVSARDPIACTKEALNYFRQYWMDGEYKLTAKEVMR